VQNLLATIVITVISLASHSALACKSDVDCKGNRICDAGQCTGPAPSTQATSPNWQAPTPANASWAHKAALWGYVGAGATIGLAIASYSTWEDTGTSIALGGVATLIGGVTGPITAAGSESARAHGARGIPVFQTTGWVTYSLSMLNAVTLIALAAADESPAGWLTLTTGSMGAMSLLFFAADAQAAANDLDARTAQAHSPNSITLAPMVSPWLTRTGFRQLKPTGAVAGLNVSF